MRAAFEFARLLLSLDPFTDPHGALLYLDFLAPKSGMNEFLLKLWDTWVEVDKEEAMGPDDEEMRVRPQYLPGMWFGRAVAMRNLEVNKGDKVGWLRLVSSCCRLGHSLIPPFYYCTRTIRTTRRARERWRKRSWPFPLSYRFSRIRLGSTCPRTHEASHPCGSRRHGSKLTSTHSHRYPTY